MTRCELTELLTDQCAHCLGHQDPILDIDISGFGVGPRFTARYDSTCGVCRGPIVAGEGIAALDGRPMYACAGCLP